MGRFYLKEMQKSGRWEVAYICDINPDCPAPEKALEDMTVTELRSFAAAHGIDVTGAAKKQDLLLAVQTAVEPSAAPAEAVPGEQPETTAE